MARFTRWQDLIVPLGVLAGILVALAPLPTGLLDVFLALNLTVSVVILLTTIYVRTPLEFSVFPTLLLATTLGRLVLNIASTRLILTRASTNGLDAAGGVIRAFGEYVTGDRLMVGLILFLILFVIQFIVITKGSTRISEVAARFTLDALPGRQMAIDADVQAGALTPQEAQRRRQDLNRQADFYAAMDGAGKFIRGDALAGLVIVVLNIVGGLAMGVFSGQMSVTEAADVFTRLTIGDGLVSQIPALLVSLAAGLLTTRSGEASNLASDLITQLISRPRVLVLAAVFLGVLSFTSLPALPLLSIGGVCLAAAFFGSRGVGADAANPENGTNARATANGGPTNGASVGRQATGGAAASSQGRGDPVRSEVVRPDASRTREERIEDYLAVDPLEIELGMRLLRLADSQRGGDLLKQITSVRQQMASAVGIVLPKVRVRDNLRLADRGYQIRIANTPVAQGMIHPDKFLAVDGGGASGSLSGEPTEDPASHRPAVWIAPAQRERAEALGYDVVEPVAVVANHLREIVRQHADELLTRDAVKHLIEELRRTAPAVVDELIPHALKISDVQQVLRLLLREEVPVRQLGLILEALGDYAPRTTDPRQLAEHVRQRLARTLSAQYRDAQRRLHVITLDPALEERLAANLTATPNGFAARWAPDLIDALCDALSAESQKLQRQQRPAVALVSPTVRALLKQVTQARLPRLVVLSYQEISRDTHVESIGMIADPSHADPLLAESLENENLFVG